MTKREVFASVLLLCVVAIFTAFAAGSQPHPTMLGTFAQYLLPAILTLYLLFVVANAKVIIDLLASFFLANRSPQDSGGRSPWVILGYAIAVILVFVFFRSVMQTAITNVAAVVAATVAAFSLGKPQGTSIASAQTNPALLYYTLLVFGAVVLVSFGLFFGGLKTAYHMIREEHAPFPSVPARIEASKVIQKAAMSLKLTGDYRETILNCYRQMCNVLSERGFGIEPTQTASEFAHSVSIRLGLGGSAVNGLTFLFEEARYSNHQIDDSRRTEAINQLETLERSLVEVSL